MSRDYKRLDVVTFGKELIDTQDLDPVYVMVAGGRFRQHKLYRWLLAYWCYYHAGTASWICEKEGKLFWQRMIHADVKRYPRGRERRHFRGGASAKAIRWLKNKFPHPESALNRLRGLKTFTEVEEALEDWPAFGPWIAFKVADMLERVLGWPVQFTYDDLGFYKEPVAGAAMVDPVADLTTTVKWLEKEYRKLHAPPYVGFAPERKIGIQEVETVLCKFKSHMNGHYPIGIDSKELAEALDKQKSWTAEELKRWVPSIRPST